MRISPEVRLSVGNSTAAMVLEDIINCISFFVERGTTPDLKSQEREVLNEILSDILETASVKLEAFKQYFNTYTRLHNGEEGLQSAEEFWSEMNDLLDKRLCPFLEKESPIPMAERMEWRDKVLNLKDQIIGRILTPSAHELEWGR